MSFYVFFFIFWGLHVGRMGCVPACGGNSNSRDVSCSQPILHCQGAALGWMRFINGRSIKTCLHIPFGYMRYSKDRLNTNVPFTANDNSMMLGLISSKHKFTSVQHKFASVQHKFASVQHKFASVQHKFASVQHKFTSVQHEFASVQ